MAQLSAETSKKPAARKGRRIVFYVLVGLALASMALFPPILIGPIIAWLDESILDSLFGEQGLGAHRVHIEGATLLFWLTIIAMVSQFRSPESHAAPLWAAAAAWVIFLPIELSHLVDPFTIVVTALILAVIALHPRRWPEASVSWIRQARVIAILGAVGWVSYAYRQALFQLTGLPDDIHVAASHYGLMAALGVGLSLSILLGATNFPGSRISAWTAGGMTIALGAFFVAHPDQASSTGGSGALMALWAIIYLVVTTRSPHRGAAIAAR